MKLRQIFGLVFFLCCLSSCDEDLTANKGPGSCCEDDEQILTGSWLLTEHGYSSGAGYTTKSVSPTPQQKITFRSDSTLETTGEVFKDYKFYTLNTDPISGKKFVIFYKKYPEQQVEDSAPSYDFSVRDNHTVLYLRFRWCYEGCHLGFKAID